MILTAPDKHPPAYRRGLLLCNLGTPASTSRGDVRQFLKEFLSDPYVVHLPRPLWYLALYGVILPFRTPKSQHAYQKIWTPEGSPLMIYSTRLANSLREQFNDPGWMVELGMTYGQPSIQDALERMKQAAIRELIVLPLYPQYSFTTHPSCFKQITEHLQNWRFQPHLRMIQGYSSNPHYIKTLARNIQNFWEQHGKSQKLLMSFHGLPKHHLQNGDPYFCFCAQTARLIAESLKLTPEEWTFGFQSRLGRSEWLKPYTHELLTSLPQEEVKTIDIVCPGFSVDCLETLEEIAIQNKELFLNAGGEQFRYIPCLNDSVEHTQMLMNLIHEKS